MLSLFDFETFIIQNVTLEMFEWLNEHCEKDKYHVEINMVRYRWAGPNVPLEKCQRKEGMKITFSEKSDAMRFKLIFAEDMKPPRSTEFI